MLIDLVGYRRYGHNEGDEPAYTQPLLYDKITNHPTVRALWARQLDAEQVVPLDASNRMLDEAIASLKEINRQLATPEPRPETAERQAGSDDTAAITTAVPYERLSAYNEQLMRLPAASPHIRA